MSERDVLAGGDGELDDLEHAAGSLPLEERRPGLPVGVEAPDPVVRWGYVEHHDDRRGVLQHRLEVAGVHGTGPAVDQAMDLVTHEPKTSMSARAHRRQSEKNRPPKPF